MLYKKTVCLIFLFGALPISGMMNRRKKNTNQLDIPPVSEKILDPNHKNIKVTVLSRKENNITYIYKNKVGNLYRKTPGKNQQYFFEFWFDKKQSNSSFYIISIQLNKVQYRKFNYKEFTNKIIFESCIPNKTYKELEIIFTENTKILKLQKRKINS